MTVLDGLAVVDMAADVVARTAAMLGAHLDRLALDDRQVLGPQVDAIEAAAQHVRATIEGLRLLAGVDTGRSAWCTCGDLLPVDALHGHHHT